MYALIQTGGKQFKVSEGTMLKVEKLAGEKGDTLVFDQVLMIAGDEGEAKIGSPILDGAKVTAEIIEQGKNKKVVVYKYKKRKNYRKKQGHRQPFTKVIVKSIEG